MPIMQRGEEEDPPAGAQAAPLTLPEVLQGFQLSDHSNAQITAFVNSLVPGISKPQFRKLLAYVLKFVEYNTSKYEMLRNEQRRLHEQILSMREELNHFMTMQQEKLPRVAPVPDHPPPIMAPPPTMASQPSLASLAITTQATAHMPSAPLATASLATVPVTMPQPSAFQAAAPPFAPQAIPGPFVAPVAFSPAILNADGTISRRMDQVGNNVTVTFSGNDEMASKKSKHFGSSA